jgi:hypothetical protein
MLALLKFKFRQISENAPTWAMTFELIFYVVSVQLCPVTALLVPPPMTKLFSHIEMVKSAAIWKKSAA